MTTWYTAPDEGEELERLTNAWPDAPIEKSELLAMLLEVAKEQVLAYGPTIPAGNTLQDGYVVPVPNPIPTRFVLAQLYQAQALWDDGRTDGNGQIGEGAFIFTPRPLDKKIRGIIRPMDGKPHAL